MSIPADRQRELCRAFIVHSHGDDIRKALEDICCQYPLLHQATHPPAWIRNGSQLLAQIERETDALVTGLEYSEANRQRDKELEP